MDRSFITLALIGGAVVLGAVVIAKRSGLLSGVDSEVSLARELPHGDRYRTWIHGAAILALVCCASFAGHVPLLLSVGVASILWSLALAIRRRQLHPNFLLGVFAGSLFTLVAMSLLVGT